MKNLELKIPPPLVGLIIAFLMWLLADIAPALTMGWSFIIGLLAAVLAGCGVLVSLAGVLAFRRARTTVSPLKPETSSSLVTSGIYARTRNPMYVGMLLVLVGWATYLGSLLGVLGPVAFVLYITRFQIIPEERVMQKLFGSAFSEYEKHVRRWV
jgi:protein-S-isoprenylcysteine O-methyltransferase Ste14